MMGRCKKEAGREGPHTDVHAQKVLNKARQPRGISTSITRVPRPVLHENDTLNRSLGVCTQHAHRLARLAAGQPHHRQRPRSGEELF